jgi:hypothetical protein
MEKMVFCIFLKQRRNNGTENIPVLNSLDSDRFSSTPIKVNFAEISA